MVRRMGDGRREDEGGEGRGGEGGRKSGQKSTSS